MSAPLPYTPSKEPVILDIPFNNATFKTAFWGVPKGTPVKGRILYMHGFSDYYRSHTKLFDLISQDGYEVFTYDQRGSGYTSPGKLKAITNEKHVFDDLDFFIEYNLNEMDKSGRYLFLSGHSMGGGIVLNYGVKGKYKDRIKGVIGVAPLILLHENIRPWPITMTALEILTYLMPNMKYNSGLKLEYLTADSSWREYFLKDKIIAPGYLTLRQGFDFIKRGERLVDDKFLKNWDPAIPVLVLHGTVDKVNQPESSQEFIELLANRGIDSQFKGIKDCEHYMFCETDKLFKETFDAFKQWLDDRI